MTTQATILKITGMTCRSCARHVDDALRHVPGVSAVDVDQRTGMAHVTHTSGTTTEALIAATVEAGYDATRVS